MTPTAIYGLTGAALAALGLYGLLTRRHLLRRLLAFNLIGSGAFLLFGAFAVRAPGPGADPVPHAMIITGIVVAFSATALGVMLLLALHERTGAVSLEEAEDEGLDE